MEVNLPFLLCFTLYLRAILQVQGPRELIFWRDDLTEGFCVTGLGGLIFGGAYLRNFTVFHESKDYFCSPITRNIFFRSRFTVIKNRRSRFTEKIPLPGVSQHNEMTRFFSKVNMILVYSLFLLLLLLFIFLLKITDGRRIPENERRKDDIRQMGDHRLKRLVLRCIEDESDERLNAKEVVDWLQKVKMSKIKWERTIALQRKPNQPPTLNIITLGEAGTGKTSIINRFVNNCFDDKVVATIGIDLRFTNMNVYGREFRLKVVDTAGLETFSSLPVSYLREANGVLLVFDVTDRRSFERGILRKMLRCIDRDEKRIILVGSKVDAEDEREVTREQAEEFAANLGVLYFETSALTGQNIQKVFEEITKVIYITSDLTNPTVKEVQEPVWRDVVVLRDSPEKETTSSWCTSC